MKCFVVYLNDHYYVDCIYILTGREFYITAQIKHLKTVYNADTYVFIV